jgi:hypothetical protein
MFHDFKYLIRDFKRLDFIFYKILLDKKATDIAYQFYSL